MSNHTPGPWQVSLLDKYPNEAFVNWPNGFASVNGSRAGREANARLIAAAPDLLAALRECLTCEFAVTDKAVIAKAKSAIARAVGAAQRWQ